MGEAKMVLLQKCVDHQLPVHARMNRHGSMQFPARHVLVREIGLHRPEIGVDINRRVLAGCERRRHRPGKAVSFLDGELAKTMARTIDVAERRAIGDAQQAARKVVAPSVIGTDDGALGGAAWLGLDPGRAMAADIEKGAQYAVSAAYDQDGLAGVVMGGKIPRLAQLAGERRDHRIAAEQQPDFSVAALRIEILIDRGATEPRRVVARIGAHHGEEAVQKGYLVRLSHGQFFPPCFCLTPDAYFRESISVARMVHSSGSDTVGTDRPARWYHPPAFLMSPSWRCRCACTQSQSGSPSCCWTHSCAFFQSPRSAHQSACKAGPISGGGVVADTLLRNASIVVMIVDPLSLNDPRHGRQNYLDLSEPHQVRRILAGIFGAAPLQTTSSSCRSADLPVRS